MSSFFMIVLGINLVIFLVILITALIIINKSRKTLNDVFGTTNIKEVAEMTELDEQNTPKSVSSLESIYLRDIESDFKDVNINELKRIVENYLLAYLGQDMELLDDKLLSNKVRNIIKINNKKNKGLYNIEFHKTVINKYDNKDGVATISFNTSLEYRESESKKIQTRFQTELIYIIDYEQFDSSILIGLNCPNCGAPIKNMDKKTCEYCGTGVVDQVSKSWILNNIKKY